MDCSKPGFSVHHQFLELAQTHVHRVGDAIQPLHPLPSPSPPASIFPSIRVFSNELAFSIRYQRSFSFNFSVSPSNEYLGLISFRMDWLDLLAVQGALKSLLKHHSSKASILWPSAFFIVQLSHPYMTTGETIALTAAAAAKLLQSCPTLCNPIDSSPPSSPVPGIFQARTLEWIAISFSNAWKWKVKVKSFSHVWLLVTWWTAAYQAPPSVGFSPKELSMSCYYGILWNSSHSLSN